MIRVRRLSVAYIGPKSRTERSRKTEIGTEVAHVTRDSDTTFKVKGQCHKGRGPIVAASRLQIVIIKPDWMLQTVTSFVMRIRLGGRGYAPAADCPLMKHSKGLSEFTELMLKLHTVIEEDGNVE